MLLILKIDHYFFDESMHKGVWKYVNLSVKSWHPFPSVSTVKLLRIATPCPELTLRDVLKDMQSDQITVILELEICHPIWHRHLSAPETG
jgi:hypothetical protein